MSTTLHVEDAVHPEGWSDKANQARGHLEAKLSKMHDDRTVAQLKSQLAQPVYSSSTATWDVTLDAVGEFTTPL